MVVRRKLEAAGEGLNIVTEGCAFGGKDAYKEAMAQLPPAVKAAREGGRGVELKVDAEPMNGYGSCGDATVSGSVGRARLFCL